MWLIVKEQGESKIEIIPEGVYPARCYAVVDFWTQEKKFKDQDKDVHEIGIYFEIPELSYEYEDKETKEKKTGSKTIWTTLSASLSSKSNMRKFLETWRGKKFTEEELKGFDLKNVLWVKAMLQVVHSEDGKWANIQAAMPLYKWVTVDKTDREQILFEIDFEKAEKQEWFCDEDIFEKLPEFMQTKISNSKEYRKYHGIETLDAQEERLDKIAKEPKKEITKEEVENVFWEK